jgi:hypothetical protein
MHGYMGNTSASFAVTTSGQWGWPIPYMLMRQTADMFQLWTEHKATTAIGPPTSFLETWWVIKATAFLHLNDTRKLFLDNWIMKSSPKSKIVLSHFC